MMPMFTRREKIVIILFAVILVLSVAIPQPIIHEYQSLILVLTVLPLGILILTDPERNHREK